MPTLEGNFYRVTFEGDIFVWRGEVYIRPVNLDELIQENIKFFPLIFGPRISKVIVLDGNGSLIGSRTIVISHLRQEWLYIGSLQGLVNKLEDKNFKYIETPSKIINCILQFYLDKMIDNLTKIFQTQSFSS